MKKKNFLSQVVIITTILCTSVLFAKADTNFYAWDMTTERPGATDGIACGSLNFTEDDITIELWLNIPESNFNNGVTIASTRHNGDKGFSLDISSDGRLRGFFRNDYGDRLNSRPDDYIFPFFFEKEDIVDKWVHIAIVFSSTDNIARSYLNGEIYEDMVKSTEPYESYNIGWIGNDAGAMRLGYWYQESGKFYGKIADFRIWSVGRTDEEIKANYNKNLTGTYEDNPGLYLNYRFYSYERGFNNDANPDNTTNKGWCNPEGGWNNYYKRETLAAFPQDITINDEVMSWNTSDGEWEVIIFDEEDNEVFTDTTTVNSLSLNDISDLSANTNYYAKVRTFNNGFWSGQVTSETFTISKTTVGIDRIENGFTIVSKNNNLIINSDSPRVVTLRAVDGRVVRSVEVSEGTTIVDGLAKGIYLINNQKVIVR